MNINNSALELMRVLFVIYFVNFISSASSVILLNNTLGANSIYKFDQYCVLDAPLGVNVHNNSQFIWGVSNFNSTIGYCFQIEHSGDYSFQVQGYFTNFSNSFRAGKYSNLNNLTLAQCPLSQSNISSWCSLYNFTLNTLLVETIVYQHQINTLSCESRQPCGVSNVRLVRRPRTLISSPQNNLTLTTATKKPNGSKLAFLIVLGSLCALFIIWGLFNMINQNKNNMGQVTDEDIFVKGLRQCVADQDFSASRNGSVVHHVRPYEPELCVFKAHTFFFMFALIL